MPPSPSVQDAPPVSAAGRHRRLGAPGLPPADEGAHPPATGRAAGRAEPRAPCRPTSSASEVRVAHPRAVPVREGPAQRRRAGKAHGRGDGRDLRPRAAGAAAEGLRPSPTSWSTASTASTSSAAAGWSWPTSASATTPTCGRSSTASSPGSAGASMRSARWSMPACPTAAASTPSSRRWPWTARRCRSAASAPSRCSWRT